MSPKLVHYRVRSAPRRVRVGCRIAEVGFALVVGWTDPEGGRPYLGALLPAYYDPDGTLIYAGRVGTDIDTAELEHLWRRLQPLATARMLLTEPPPRSSRFGSLLVLSRVHWVRPVLVVEVKFLAWTADSLLREVVYEALREDKPTTEVRREVAASEIWHRQEKPVTALSCADCGATTVGLMISGHCQPEVPDANSTPERDSRY